MDRSHGPQLLFSQQLHKGKYRLPNEDFREGVNRSASALKDDDDHFHQVRSITLDMRFMFAGRIQAAMGAPRLVTAHNCFVSGIVHDSFTKDYGNIMQRATEAADTMRMGGGIGYDFSRLRPDGELIRGVMSRTKGPLAFLPVYDAICKATSSSGNRRGAMMGVLRIDHPDIEAFVLLKQGLGILEGFNLSVAVTDEFMQCLAAGRPFPLKWNGRTFREIDPAALWEMIMRGTWDWGDPGVLFIDTINRLNNLWYCEKIEATNPCVPGDVSILTREGHVQIAERVGLDTEIWNGNEWSWVKPYSTGVNRVLEVQLSNGGLLRCTPHHEFVLVGDRRVQAQHLNPGDHLRKFDMPIVECGEDYVGDGYSQGFYSGDGTRGQTKSWVYRPKYSCIGRLRGSTGDNEHPVRGFRVWSHGPMLDKSFVPIRGNLEYCLDWLAGLLDADGTVVYSVDKPSLQLTSVDRKFMSDVQLMLTRMGVRAHLGEERHTNNSWSKDGRGLAWRICVNQIDTQSLLGLGLRTERLRIPAAEVQRDARRFTCVTEVVELDPEETFCFTEPKNGTGTFDGIVTGQCGEQPLPPYGACLLGSFNLVKYVGRTPTGWAFDWDQFRADIPPIVRAMDNVVDRSQYPLPQQKMEAIAKRRMGLGITGLANTAEVLGHPYASPGFMEFELRVLEELRDGAYLASTELAREKGAFPKYDRDLFLAGEHAKTLPENVREAIHRLGLRNSHLISMAPTGTISFCADYVSSGIEPVFEYESRRRVNMPEGEVVVDVSDYGFREFGVRGRLAEDVTAQEHVDVLAAASALTDSAVSKTCNVNGSMPWDDFKDLYTQAWERECKGCTTFNKDGKKMGILLSSEAGEESQDGVCLVDPATGQRDCG